MKPILLDTCALIWLSNGQPMATAARDSLRAVEDQPNAVLVSPISAWEIGLLVARGRLALTLNPADWFRRALQVGVALAELPPDVLIASSFLPPSDLRDPGDRVIAATARAFGYRLMTRDAPLLAFGSAGHLEVIAC